MIDAGRCTTEHPAIAPDGNVEGSFWTWMWIGSQRLISARNVFRTSILPRRSEYTEFPSMSVCPPTTYRVPWAV
jgi:hypothetical protein